jgi:flagellar motor switch protein FliM
MNQQILTQDEVDALLQGITGESQKLEQEEQRRAPAIREYDLASQERIVRGRMPTMEIVNERFARNIRVGLFNMIRKSPEVSIGGIKVQKYSAFLREIVVPTNFNIVSVKPLRGNGLIVCDPSAGVRSDRRAVRRRRQVPHPHRGARLLAHRVARHPRLVEVITHRIPKAWKRHLPARAGIPALGDAAAVRQHRLAQRDGGLHLVHAGDRRRHRHGAHLHPVLDAGADPRHAVLGHARRHRGAATAAGSTDEDQIQSAEVELVAELANMHRPRSSSCCPSSRATSSSWTCDPVIQAKVDGVPVFDCHYGTSNGKYAIKIDQLLTGQDWLAGRRNMSADKRRDVRRRPHGRRMGRCAGGEQARSSAPAQPARWRLPPDRWRRPRSPTSTRPRGALANPVPRTT